MKITSIAGSKRAWGYASSDHAEHFDGAFDSREEAIDEARELFGHEPFWIIEGYYPDPAEAMPSTERVLEEMAEYAHDNWMRETDDWPPATTEQAKELEAFLAEWARKYCKPTFWIGIGTPERIEAEAK